VTEPGVLVEETGHGAVAWAGLRLGPARRLRDHRGYATLPEEQRRAEAAAAELAWLTAQCRPGAATRFELRCTSDGGLLRCVLLGRADAATPGAAAETVRLLLELLARLPAHVRSEPIGDPDELRVELNALTPDGSPPPVVDLREIRKLLVGRPIARPNPGRRHSVTAAPFEAPTGRSWEPFWTALARQPSATTLSVCLQPTQLPPGTDLVLRQFAEAYAQLAMPSGGSPLWAGARRGDPAAEAGRDFFDDAVRRYLGPSYRLRVTLAAAGAIPPGLAELLADQLGGAAVLTPADAERATAWQNLTGLGLAPLPETYRQHVDQASWTEIEQELAGLADRHEAAAAFRLPYEIGGRPELFVQPPFGAEPVPEPTPATGRETADPGRPRY